MTSVHPPQPLFGVRYEFTLASSTVDTALYEVEVFTSAQRWTLSVAIDRAGAKALAPPADLDPAHLAQLLALARTLSRRDEAPWPRRIQRWRSPGVR